MTTAVKDRLGVPVIGQAPRDDIEAELRAVLGSAVGITVVGALDGLSREAIDGLRPAGPHDALFTTLRDGAGVVVSTAEVTRRAQARLDHLADAGIGVTLVSCTGVFEGLVPRGHLVFPSAVLTGAVRGLLPCGRLGVLAPLAEQEATMRVRAASGIRAVLAVSAAARAVQELLD